ncbi:hypothetical protein FDECE_8513 [Fusarium decemcellulare]|nr:hypothetical protein FDECE_8513 [Fusarium decemcellulare]
MTAQDFSALPHPVASDANLQPFKIAVPQTDIEKLHLLLDNSPITDANWENSHAGERFGTTRDWVIHAIKEWRKGYNWRQWEDKFNSHPQYTIDVTDDDGKVYTTRFNALFSQRPNAIPILFLHGWPGSAVEFLPLLDIIRHKYSTSNSLPYHILVPDLIGFGFSSRPPLDKDFDCIDHARILAKLMLTMGFTSENGGYVVQGGDLGAIIAPRIAALDPEACRLAHVNMLFMAPPKGTIVEEDIGAGKYTDAELEALSNGKEFIATGFAYAAIQGTRPATLGLAIGSSPVALLSWIGEKFLQWSDPETRPSLELILTNVSFYWFSKCYSTSIWPYRLIVSGETAFGSPFDGVQCPVAYSWFRREISSPPKLWLDRDGKVKWYRSHDRGGHFAALEQPEVLWKDVVDFITGSGLQPHIPL